MLKTVLSALGFFATLPCALLGLTGGHMLVSSTNGVFFDGQKATVNVVGDYLGKSLFAQDLVVEVVVKNKLCYSFTPQVSSGWNVTAKPLQLVDGYSCLLLSLTQDTHTDFLLYRLNSSQPQLISQWKILL